LLLNVPTAGGAPPSQAPPEFGTFAKVVPPESPVSSLMKKHVSDFDNAAAVHWSVVIVPRLMVFGLVESVPEARNVRDGSFAERAAGVASV
jgi:hypothetical protein